jgi:hypothetical protein
MQHLDDVIVEVGRGVFCPAGNQSGDDPVSDLSGHEAENDDDEGLKAWVGGQVVERTEPTQKIVQGLHHSPPETADGSCGSLGREATQPANMGDKMRPWSVGRQMESARRIAIAES